MFVRQKLNQLLQNALRKAEEKHTVLIPDGVCAFTVRTENYLFGDYTTTLPFQLAKKWNVSPEEVGHELKEILEQEVPLFFKEIKIDRGFLNFFLQESVYTKELATILRQKNKFGLFAKKNLKINLEFISANPTGPLTMANGRGGFLGDVLANVLERVGYTVTREYYINDAGNQIKILGESILAKVHKTPHQKKEQYQGVYIEELAKELPKNILEKDADTVGKATAKILLKKIEKSVKNAGIRFNTWFSEYENLHKRGEIKKTLELLEKKGLVTHHDGATWLASSDIKDEKDRVLVKSDGEPTYSLADMAYHYDKFVKRKFDTAITIWGADHHGLVERLRAGVKALGIDTNRLKIIITQLVRLTKNGQEVKMSKRAGEFITLDELVKEVGVDAARFFFLMHAPNTHMDFDMALAKEKSNKNPVYYAQYSYARIASILRADKAGKKNLFPEKKDDKKEQDALIKKLTEFPEIIEDTAEDYHALRLTTYALELARAFHHFYETHPILLADRKLRAERLKIVQAVKIVLKNTFDVLGISAPEKM